MPAACSLSGRLSMRKASITMSCVAEAVATSSAPSATSHGDAAGSQKAEENDRRDQQELRKNQPAAPPAEQRRQHRHVERIDDRRPQELDGVGRADEREQADGAEIDARFPHPDQQRRAGQRKRQPGGEAEEQHDQHARLEIDRERVGEARAGAARCRASRSSAQLSLNRRADTSLRLRPKVIGRSLDASSSGRSQNIGR